MGYRKIFLAVDCANEAEVAAMQEFGKEISQIFQFKASGILRLAPIIRKNSGLIVKVAKTISTEGAVGVAKMIPYFMANVKK